MGLNKKTKVLFASIFALVAAINFVFPTFAATSQTGQLVQSLWDNTIYTVIKEVGGTLAIATFVCSAFYFFIIGKSKAGIDLARSLMIGAAVGIMIIYLGPIIVNAVINAMSNVG